MEQRENAMANLGRRGRDRVTGFEGLITSLVCYLTGCDHYGITPKVDEKGNLQAIEYFDVPRIEILPETGMDKEQISDSSRPGGPQRNNPPK